MSLRFLKSSFFRNVAVLASGTVLGQGLIVLSSPFLTRLYTPEDFGVLAVYSSLLAFVVVGSWRYHLAIPLAEDDVSAANILTLSCMALLITTSLVALGVWLLGNSLATWTNTPNLQTYLWLLPPGYLMAGMHEILKYWAIRQKAYTTLAHTKFSQGLGQVITQLLLGIANLKPIGLLIGDVVGRASGSTRIALLAWKKNHRALQKISVKGVSDLAWRYRRFPLFSGVSSILNIGGLQVPAILIAAFYGTQTAGWFALGQRVISIPMAFIGVAISQVYLSEAAELAQAQPGELQRFFFKIERKLLMISVLPALVLGLGAPWLFSVAFGNEWLEAGKYVQVLSLMFLVQFIVTPVSQTLNVLERQDWQLAWDAGRLAVVVGALYGSALLALPARAALAVYGVAMTVSYGCLFLLIAIALRQQTNQTS